MNQVHRSSSGCCVTVGDVAPDTHVSGEVVRQKLTK